ncbi:oligopeptide/dipeptide ABC transporter ATP-binding protein, partial [Acinetobacter baumannii]
AHPYTRGLFAAIPRLGDGRARDRARPLATITGTVPELADMPPGCAFAPRCDLAVEACRLAQPPLLSIGHAHVAACIRTDQTV